MADFLQSIKDHSDTPDDAHGSLGKARTGGMNDAHTEFAKKLSALMRKGTIDPMNSETFLNPEIYATLDPTLKIKVDTMLPNIATLLSHIVGFFDSKETPNSSPELASLIENLWEMKERIEKDADVFVF